MGSVGSAAVVLLCAEEDDLELVRWVHAARGQGLAPEVVTGIEHDDGPLLEALAQTDEALFVVLRSDNLSADRMREIKAAFARHRRGAQRLVALRLDATAEAAVERIAKQIAGGLGSRSEHSLTLALEDVVLQRVRQGTGSHPAIVASRAAREADEERTRSARNVEPATPPSLAEPDAAPSVPGALEWANVANERATTQQYTIDDETLPLPMVEVATPRTGAGAGRIAVQIGAMVLALGAAVGIAGWLIDATAPDDAAAEVTPASSSGRVSVPRATEERVDEAPVVEPAIAAPRPAVREAEPRAVPHRKAKARSQVRELPPPPSDAPVVEATPVAAPEAAVAPPAEEAAVPSEPAPLEGERQGATL